jgi:uncharacterized membrane protein YkgB
LARYGLVVVIAWIGVLKFTSHEAHGIQPLVANIPFMSWSYDIVSVNTFSTLLGVLELATAVLLAVKPWWPRVSALGSVIAIGLSWPRSASCSPRQASAGGFPVLSFTGEFLINDAALLGISVWTLGDALRTSRQAIG